MLNARCNDSKRFDILDDVNGDGWLQQDPDDLQMLIGTGSNEIVLSSRQSRKHNIIMQGHHGGVINAVAAHPSKMLFVTGLITHPDPLQSTSHTPPPFSSFTTPAPLFPLLLVPPAAR